ncbi:MAG: imidazole glycerol phosphate synthase subunit HisH [Planctomycetota bacterium]
MSMIGILDYGMGNLRSVQKAFDRLGGTRAVVVSDPDDVVGCEKLILPGVGNFADGMRLLGERGMVEPVRRFLDTGRPLLGVCMGMQLLFDSSTEQVDDVGGEPVAGLGVVPGRVVRFREDRGGEASGGGASGGRLKVPHMGWNRLEPVDDSPLFAGLDEEAYVYFVHGYHCVPDDASAVAATADYGGPFCAAVHRDHVWATQFHPEKSQRVGLQILKNFAAL